ncbi:MAG TPA: hypothetical protein VIX11_01285 [Candidatus Acidoferrum sp.]
MKNLRRRGLIGSAGLFAGLLLCCCHAFGQAPAGPQPATEVSTSAASSAMDALLRARKTVEKYFEQAANVVCTENVTQAVVGKNGKSNYREDSVFDYQLQVNTSSGFLKLVESRDTHKAAFRDSARTLLITNGFTSMLLIIHPNYEASYTFEAVGEETVDGVTLAKINFKPIPGASSPAAFQLRGQSYPMPLFGTIWIEEQTGAVSKLIAAVDTSLGDLGLQGMRSEIHYATVHFHDPEESYWMPISAVIDVETPRQHWRNIHRFAGYKRFRATIQVEEAEVKP